MYVKIDYIITDNRIKIKKLYGFGDTVQIPGVICGLPVTEIAPYAFSSSTMRNAKDEEIHTITLGEEEVLVQGQEPYPLCGELVTSIELPDTVETIGDYAFYYCRNLQKLMFTGALKTIGGGAFMGCPNLRKIEIVQVTADKNALMDVTTELHHELEVSIAYADGSRAKVIFPEFYEDAIENTPARNVDMYFHGTGYAYRQCFQNTKIDFLRYDMIFPKAVAKDFQSTVLLIAVNRLLYPMGLLEIYEKGYQDYLGQHPAEAANLLLRQDEIELLLQLIEMKIWQEKELDAIMKASNRFQKTEVVSFILDYKNLHFKKQQKSFEF